MSKIKLIGGVLLLLGAAALAWMFAGQNGGNGGLAPVNLDSLETVRIRYGSEKKGLLHDEKFKSILAKRYGLKVDGTKMGSLELSEGSLDGVDGAWPSSELAALVFADRHPNASRKQSNIFNTPIVFYSWPEITQALMDAGVVEQRDNSYFVVDTRGLLDMVVQQKTWKDLGLNKQNGLLAVRSTDPTKSNSGFLVAGLMAVILNDGRVVTEQTLPEILDTIKNIYNSMGYLENSTGILFDKFIKQGRGAFPLISAYESLIIEFYRAYPDYQERIRNTVRVLIPEPTVWSGHPFMALTPAGEKLLTALQDEDVQQLAWDQYGFRSGVMGMDNDPGVLKEIGLPQTIDSVAPLPSPQVMDRILQILLQ